MAIREAPAVWAEPQTEPADHTNPRTIRALLLAVVGLASLAAGIHAWVVPEHMMELAEGNVPGWLPLAFAVSAGVGFLYVLGIGVFGASRHWLAIGLGLHATMAAAGILSRTWGLPGAEVEGPTRAWIMATAAELAVAVLCGVLLTMLPARSGQRSRVTPGLVLIGGVIVVALAVGLVLVGAPEVIDHAKMLGLVKPDAWMWGVLNGAWLKPFAWMWGVQNGALHLLGNKWW